MEFWEGERCEYCNGLIVEKRVDLHRKVKGRYVLLENVPAGVCTDCGMRYYAANVLKTIEETMHGRQKAERKVFVPVYSLWPLESVLEATTQAVVPTVRTPERPPAFA